MRLRLALISLAAALLGSIAAFAPAASADVPVESFGMLPSNTQAGGHPDVQIAFR